MQICIFLYSFIYILICFFWLTCSLGSFQQDNVANETLLSFEPAHWGKSGTKAEGLDGGGTVVGTFGGLEGRAERDFAGVGIKNVFRNWSKGSSLWGTLCLGSCWGNMVSEFFEGRDRMPVHSHIFCHILF